MRILTTIIMVFSMAFYCNAVENTGESGEMRNSAQDAIIANYRNSPAGKARAAQEAAAAEEKTKTVKKEVSTKLPKTQETNVAPSHYSNEDTILEDSIQVLCFLVFLLFVGLLIAGMSNKIVIYYDSSDFLISFMPFGTLFIAFIIMAILKPKNSDETTVVQYIVLVLGCLGSLAFAVWSVRLSISHNRNTVLGVIVGIFKMFAALLGILVLIGQINKFFDKESNLKDMIIAVVVFGVFIWLGKKLINGEAVYIAKGWAVLEKSEELVES